MAKQDIMPADSPGGGHCRVLEFPVAAAQTFVEGAVVRVNTSGQLVASVDNPTSANVFGIAATGGDTTAGTGTLDPDTGSVITTGGMVKVYVPDITTVFRTMNFSSAGAAFGDVAPAAGHIGDEINIELIGGNYGVGIAGSNNLGRIVDVVNADGNSVMRSGGTGVTVYFQLLAHQSTPVTGVVTAPAA